MSTTSGQGKCGLSSFFPMSCRDRAEAFARHLHSRLKSLGSEDGNSTASETSWLTTHENAVAVSHQPRHDTNLYLNLELLESPGSPEEEITERELSKLFANNRDNLQFPVTGPHTLRNGDTEALTKKKSLSQESDDLPYFDTVSENHADQKSYLNGYSIGVDNDNENFLEARDSLHVEVNDDQNTCSSCSENDILEGRIGRGEKGSVTSETPTEDISSLSSTRDEECRSLGSLKEDECTSLEYCTCTDLAIDENSKSPLGDVFNDSECFKYTFKQESSLSEIDDIIQCDETPEKVKDIENEAQKVISENSTNGPKINSRDLENVTNEIEICNISEDVIDVLQDQNQNSIHLNEIVPSNVQIQQSINERRDMPPLFISTNNGDNDECDACLNVQQTELSNNVCAETNGVSLYSGYNDDSCPDIKETYTTDAIIRLLDNTICDNNSEISQQTNERIDQKDCTENNPESLTYSSSLTIDKSLSLECSLAAIIPVDSSEENPPQSVQELHTLLQESKHVTSEEETEEREERIPRVRRCSSLKTGKTPPGTPGRKKIVRFADVLGLDLADVRTFLDEIPKIPVSAYDDLRDVEFTGSSQTNNCSIMGYATTTLPVPDRILMPLFQQPGGQPDFLDRVRDKCVCLENAMVKDPIDLSIAGTVRVRNLDFNKSLHIRYTLDAWKTFADLQATYVPNSCDGFSDKFTFLLYAHTLSVGQRLEFAVRFHCKGCQYWDNNGGVNYIFQCLPGSSSLPYLPEPTPDAVWGPGFY